jgi:hypothetical protein
VVVEVVVIIKVVVEEEVELKYFNQYQYQKPLLIH